MDKKREGLRLPSLPSFLCGPMLLVLLQLRWLPLPEKLRSCARSVTWLSLPFVLWVAVLLKDALAEVGREKMSDGGGDKKSEVAKSGLSINNKPEKPEPTKEEPKHDTRKVIASNLGP